MTPHLGFFYAIGAAALWGVLYVISEELLKRRGVSASFLVLVQAVVAVPSAFVLSYQLGGFNDGVTAMIGSYQTALLVVLAGTSFMLGNYCIMMSMTKKNATLASFIGVTYPLFTVLFVFLFLGKFDLNIYSGLGSFLVMSGVGLMFFKG